MAAFKYPPPNPKTEDFIECLAQLHECVEIHKKLTDEGLELASRERKALRSGQLSLSKKLKTIANVQVNVVGDLAKVNDNVGQLQKAFGLDTDNKQPTKSKRPIALMSQSEAVIKVGSGFGALFFLWKFGIFAVPFAWNFLIALEQYVAK